MQRLFLVLAAYSLVFFACNKKSSSDESVSEEKTTSESGFELLKPDQTGIVFSNMLNETEEENIFTYEYLYNGSGAAIGDINNDGLPDVYLTSNQGISKLFLNKGNFSFEDISEKAGVAAKPWCTGVQMVDVNNDGWLDIYVNKSSPFKKEEERANLLFINNRNLTFTEKGAEYGIDDRGLTICAAFFDMDNDGWLDLYTGNHPTNFNAEIRTGDAWQKTADYALNRLYRNQGNGKFKDITLEARMPNSTHTLSIVPFDVNEDGRMDLFVGNDYYWPDFIYVNNGNGTFSEQREKYLRSMTHSTMGVDIADFNNDGFFDIMALDMLPEDNYRRKLLQGPGNYDKFLIILGKKYGHQVMKNFLQRSNGDGTFSDVANMMGVEATDWSWSVLMADFDNDGYRDLHITNGYFRDYTNQDFMNYQAGVTRMGQDKVNYAGLIDKLPSTRIPNYTYRSVEGKRFEDVSASWGLNQPAISNGASYGDLDGDGDLDLIVCNLGEPVSVYKNLQQEKKKKNSLRLSLEGTRSNRMGLGAKVTVYAGNLVLHDRFNIYRGYQSSVEPVLHFGLGDQKADSVFIQWPSGAIQKLLKPELNKVLKVKEENNAKLPPKPAYRKMFERSESSFIPMFVHNEIEWIDFKVNFLIPQKQTIHGPGMAVSDVNGDGLDDVLISGAIGCRTLLYLQQSSGGFTQASSQPWNKQDDIEVLGALFFDADGDKDMDLYLVSGSQQHLDSNDSRYQDRLFLNDGKGNFSLKAEALPEMKSSGASVVAADIDSDGDLDLFVGGRVAVGQYPLSPRSYLLLNEGGRFRDVSAEWSADLLQPGMVSSALFTDVNNDRKPDLMLAGELMPLRIFINDGKKFSDQSANWGLLNTEGFWNSISAADLDSDGDVDYILGNKGLNSQIRATQARPFTIYMNDFDGNGVQDPVCTYFIGGKESLLHPKQELTMQMRAYVSKNFKEFEKYARADVPSVLGREAMSKARVWKAVQLASVALINEGGRFSVQTLPDAAQEAPVFGTVIEDFNQDGHPDVAMVGNSYAPMVEHGWDYSFNGLILFGDGKGKFTPASALQTGFQAPWDARSLASVQSNKGTFLLIGNNNKPMQVYKWLNPEKFVSVPANAAYALYRKNGREVKREIYWGQGYLSQSSRSIPAADLEGIYDQKGQRLKL